MHMFIHVHVHAHVHTHIVSVVFITSSFSIAISPNPNQRRPILLPNCTVFPTGKRLGSGSYGDVLEVEYKGRKCAAKIYRSERQSKLVQEYEIGGKLKHPNIVLHLGICKLANDGRYGILMEKMEVNLGTYIEGHDDVNIPLLQKFRVLYHIARGLDYLQNHRPVIVHGDLSATNILLDSKREAKIGDFGNSCTVDFNATLEVMTSKPGTRIYMPPEVLEDGVYNEKLDIFSFGHLAIYTIIQHQLYPLKQRIHRVHENHVVKREVERRQIYIEEMRTKLGNAEHHFVTIIAGCLQDEPDRRPTSLTILQALTTCVGTCSKGAIPTGIGGQSKLTP